MSLGRATTDRTDQEDDLSREIARLIADGRLQATHHRYRAGESVYRKESGRRLCLVDRGNVKIATYSLVGKTCVQHIHGPGDVFGEASYADDSTEFAEAINQVTLTKVSWDQCNRLAPAAVIAHLSRRLRERQEWITHLTTLRAEHRLLQLLIRAGESRQGSSLQEIVAQGELAAIIGTTRSRAGFFLKQFESQGGLTLHRGRIVALDVRRLEELLDERLVHYSD